MCLLSKFEEMPCNVIDSYSHRCREDDKSKNLEDDPEASMIEKPPKTEADNLQWLQSLFLFSLCWSIGGVLDGDSRVKFSDFLKVLTAGTNKQYQRYVTLFQ